MLDFWTGGDDFGAVHTYRTDAEDYRGVSDLPDTVRDEHMREYGHLTLRRVIVYTRRTTGLSSSQAQAYAFNELEKIRQRLGGPEDMFVLN